MRFQTRFLFIGLAMIAATAPLSSQTISLTRPGRYSIALEAARPQLTFDDESVGAASAALFLSGHAALGSRANLIVELPFAHAKVDGLLSESSSTVGNPYVGLQLVRDRVRFDVGGRLPLVDEGEFATLIGVAAELERMEAFLPDVASLSASIRMETGSEKGMHVAVFAGPSLLMFTGDDILNDGNELLLTYGIEPAYRGASVRAGARLLGRYVATGDDGTFADRSIHQLGLFADFGAGRVRPGVHLRFPIDEDMREDVPWILGLNVQFVLNR